MINQNCKKIIPRLNFYKAEKKIPLQMTNDNQL